MTDRPDLMRAFLATAGWADAMRRPLAGDASNRRYERLTGPQGNAILMDAAPERGEDVRPFLAIGAHLVGLGLSAPQVLAADPEAGLLLLEDLGDALYARTLIGEPWREEELYAPAVDVLARLAEAPLPPGVRTYAGDFLPLALLAFDWYRDFGDPAADTLRAEFADALGGVFNALPPLADVLILRDYHAENLIWLPGRQGAARVGLLDFQDARLGPPVYDLVSLCEDARRDVAPETDRAMRRRLRDALGLDAEALDAQAAVWASQRNLRILGVFARLCLRDGKPGYIDLIPRVWGHLQRDLAHPLLAEAARLSRALPLPDPDHLNRLRARCGTVPKR